MLPPAGARFSYQLGAAYQVPTGVRVVDRDHTARPAAGVYSICYVNAFQAQPDTIGWWQHHHPDLLLRDPAGRIVMDADWGEALLDVRTAEKRRELAAVAGEWIHECAVAGYQAVEPDNLDSYTRSRGMFSVNDALSYARLLITLAHRDALAVAQKNTPDLAGPAREAGFDFAIAEECQMYAECGAYQAVYGRHLIDIEYTPAAFIAACKDHGHAITVVLRDRDVTPEGDPRHTERWCP